MIGTNSDMRILRLEGLVRQLQRQLDAVRITAGTVAQNAWEPQQLTEGSGPSSGAFRCVVPGGGIAAGNHATCAIEQLTGGVFSSVGSAEVYNPMPSDACTAGHTLTLAAVGDGTYMALSQSCT